MIFLHKNETEIRIIDPKGINFPKSFFINSENELEKIIDEYGGKYNIYFGLNERIKNGTKAEDVISVLSLVLDVDPVRPTGFEKEASTDEEKHEADKVASQIQYDCLQKWNYKPVKADSGNGYHLYFFFPEIKITDENRSEISEKIKNTQKHFINKYSNNKVKLDNLGDLPRIIKVPGTLSIKGLNTEDRPHRMSCWVDMPEKIECPEFRDFILLQKNVDIKPIAEYSGNDISNEEWEKILSTDIKIKDLYEGKIENYKSRSEAEASLILKLLLNEISETQIYKIMNGCKIGKWQTKDESYKKLTIKNAKNFIAEKEIKTKNKNFEIIENNPFMIIQEFKNGNITNLELFEYCLNNELIDVSYGDDGKTIKSIKYNQKTLSKYLYDTFKPYFTFADTDETYVYNKENGLYEKLNENKLADFIYCLLPLRANKNDVISNVIFFFKHFENIERSEIEKKQPKNKVALRNCIFNFDIWGTEPFNSDDVFLSKVDVLYDENADCPEIEKFLNEILPKEKEVIYEIAGELIYPSNFLEKIHIFTGSGSNGKSVAIDVLGTFVGQNNCSICQLIELSKDINYTRASLFGKKLTYYSDISNEEINNLAFVKALTGEDYVSARNPYGRPFNFKFGGGLIYSANEPPMIYEDNLAIWRRIHITQFKRQIKKDEQVDRNDLMMKLTTEQELSGLLNKSFFYLKKLKENRQFSNETDEETTRKNYLRLSDTVFGFISKYIDTSVSFDEYEETNDIYNKYISFCKEIRKNPISNNKFVQIFCKHTNSVKEQKRIGNYRKYVFVGVKMSQLSHESQANRESVSSREVAKKFAEMPMTLKTAMTKGDNLSHFGGNLSKCSILDCERQTDIKTPSGIPICQKHLKQQIEMLFASEGKQELPLDYFVAIIMPEDDKLMIKDGFWSENRENMRLLTFGGE